jgi:hypothetical protein
MDYGIVKAHMYCLKHHGLCLHSSKDREIFHAYAVSYNKIFNDRTVTIIIEYLMLTLLNDN